MKLKFILTILCLGLTRFSFSQLPSTAGTHEDSTTSVHYRVDGTLEGKIESDIQKWRGADTSRTFPGGLTNLEIFINDKEAYTTYGKSKTILYILNGASVNEKDSTISVIGFIGPKDQSAGFELYINKDECLIIFFVKQKDGREIFKKAKSDEQYTSFLHRKAQYHLTLTQKPTFKKGEVIEGLVELRSWEYYEKGKNGDNKYNMNFFAFFKTDPLK